MDVFERDTNPNIKLSFKLGLIYFVTLRVVFGRGLGLNGPQAVYVTCDKLCDGWYLLDVKLTK